MGSLLAVMLLALLVIISPQIAAAFALEIWIPLWLCAMVLRKTESHGHLVLMASSFGALYYALRLPRVLLLGVLLGVALILFEEAKKGDN